MAECLQALIAGKPGALRKALNKAGLDKLDYITKIDFLCTLLSKAEEVKSSKDILDTIFLKWSGPCDSTGDIECIIAEVAGLVTLDPKVLIYVVAKMRKSIIWLLEYNLRRPLEGPMFGIVANRLMAAASHQPISRAKFINLLHVAEANGRQDAIPYLQEQIAQLSPKAPRPSWVSLKPGDNLDAKLWSPDQWKTDVETKCQITTSIAQGLNQAFERHFRLQDESGSEPSKLRQKQMMAVKMALSTSIKTPENRRSIDRIFGPTNAILDRECITGVAGGCRMLSCCCREYEEDEDKSEDLDPVSWFEGKCDSCSTRITDACYALRFPVVNGGFCGCFCSLVCLKAAPPRDLTKSQILISSIMENLESIGILDRLAPAGRHHSKSGDVEAVSLAGLPKLELESELQLVPESRVEAPKTKTDPSPLPPLVLGSWKIPAPPSGTSR